MSRKDRMTDNDAAGFPRVSGDEPDHLRDEDGRVPFSPRERG